jgi:hypothetical protein
MFYLGLAVGVIIVFVLITIAVFKNNKVSDKRHLQAMEHLAKRNDELSRQNEILIKIWQRLPKLEEDET